MKNVKVLSMYLPQYHCIPENDKFWGKGFTDWISVRNAQSLFQDHDQPRVPLDEKYYDLSDKNSISWQIQLAKQYGVYGFGIYHYWFSNDKVLLTKPAEIILNNIDLDIPFFFAWDNVSWKRTWSNLKGNDWAPLYDNAVDGVREDKVLLEYILGGEPEWKEHFNYLFPYFKDKRYVKSNGMPIFMIYHYSKEFESMSSFWNDLAKKEGLDGIQFIYRHDPALSIPRKNFVFTYEPVYSGWGGIINRGISKISKKIEKPHLHKYNYDKVWKKIISNAKGNPEIERLHGAFVNYDDTPRRGVAGKVIVGSTPDKFCNYLSELIQICQNQNKEYIFLTAWNEWGEGAYLEPDISHKYDYLEALKKALIDTGNF